MPCPEGLSQLGSSSPILRGDPPSKTHSQSAYVSLQGPVNRQTRWEETWMGRRGLADFPDSSMMGFTGQEPRKTGPNPFTPTVLWGLVLH